VSGQASPEVVAALRECLEAQQELREEFARIEARLDAEEKRRGL